MVLCVYVHTSIVHLYVMNRRGFLFFIKLSIICIKDVFSVKANTFCPTPEYLVSWSADHRAVQNVRVLPCLDALEYCRGFVII